MRLPTLYIKCPHCKLDIPLIEDKPSEAATVQTAAMLQVAQAYKQATLGKFDDDAGS